MLGEPKQIGDLVFTEYPDGSIDIAGPNGWVTFDRSERMEGSKIIGYQPPRQKCIVCGTQVTDDFLCAKHKLESEDQLAPKIEWHVYKNGRHVLKGTTSAAMGYTRWTEYAYKQGAKHYNYSEDYYYDDSGNIYTSSLTGVRTANKQKVATTV